MKRVILLSLLLSACSFSKGVEISDLKGKTVREVEKNYGKPVVIRNEGGRQMWTYKQGECHRLIFFDTDQIVQFAETRGDCSSK